MSIDIFVNGLPVRADYSEKDREQILALRKRLEECRGQAGCRIIAFLAAPPAAGKSTLAAVLEGIGGFHWTLQSVGLDGFHYANDYLATHTLPDHPDVTLRSVKGSPETFDTFALKEKLTELQRNRSVTFPFYDRTIHNPIPGAIEVSADIVLLEGNWLLLKDHPWKDLRRFADITIRLEPGDPSILRDRLISRKSAGGLSREESIEWYNKSDRRNVDRFERDSICGDISISLS